MIKKRWFLLVVLFLFFNLTYAQTDTHFESQFAVVPPGPPEEGLVEEKYDVFFELKEYDSKGSINDIHVGIDVTDKTNGKKTKSLYYVGEDGILKLRFEPGQYLISLKVDDTLTKGMDHFISFDQTINSDVRKTIYLFSVGSVIGTVYGYTGKVVKSAQIKFECGSDYGEKSDSVSDIFGSFSSYWLPVGSCRIYAVYGKKTGYKDIEIKAGELTQVDVSLSTEVTSGFNFGILFLILFILVIFAILGSYYFSKNENSKSEKPKILQRTNDIITTLKDKEKQVVNFILDNGNKSTQAKIRYGTGIPKTSLARILFGLELKKIIKIETIGKLKKIEFTPWFLGKC